MTTKEAAKRFNKKEQEIREILQKDGKIYGATKVGRKWDIKNETKIILNKKEMQAILFEIICIKNNPNGPISEKFFENEEITKEILKILSRKGYINKPDYQKKDVKKLLKGTVLTNDGLNVIKENSSFAKIKIDNLSFNLSFGPLISCKAGLINL